MAGAGDGLRPETVAIRAGRPPATPDGPLNVPITPASALRPGGRSGYARSGHTPWTALEEAIGALEGGQAVAFASGMAAVAAVIRLFAGGSVVVAGGRGGRGCVVAGVVHSATKAIGGHSDLLLGVAVTGDRALLDGLHSAREQGGATPGALEVYLCLRGLRTLPLRLERSQDNAGVLAERLNAHPGVHEVGYPGLPSHPQHQRALHTMTGAGSMLTFRVTGGAVRADAVVDAVRVITHATSLGAVETTLERRERYPRRLAPARQEPAIPGPAR